MISLTFQFDVNPRWIEQKVIDFSKLNPDFMPGFQMEIECYKKAIIHNGRDSATGKLVKGAHWPRDPTPGELPYNRWLKEVTDDNMKYNQARDEKGDTIKGTGARHIVNNIMRIRTANGEFLVTDGSLEGYDYEGNKRTRTCRHPEEWYETFFNYKLMRDDYGRLVRQCTGPRGGQFVREMPFNIDNVRKLAKKKIGDNITFVLKDETKDKNPRSIPNQGSIDSTIKFFMQPFDYLYNEEYQSKEDRAWARKIDELILSGRAKDEHHAAELAELETEEKKPVSRKDAKTGVA